MLVAFNQGDTELVPVLVNPDHIQCVREREFTTTKGKISGSLIQLKNTEAYVHEPVSVVHLRCNGQGD